MRNECNMFKYDEENENSIEIKLVDEGGSFFIICILKNKTGLHKASVQLEPDGTYERMAAQFRIFANFIEN